MAESNPMKAVATVQSPHPRHRIDLVSPFGLSASVLRAHQPLRVGELTSRMIEGGYVSTMPKSGLMGAVGTALRKGAEFKQVDGKWRVG
jgi:hypothetical protein